MHGGGGAGQLHRLRGLKWRAAPRASEHVLSMGPGGDTRRGFDKERRAFACRSTSKRRITSTTSREQSDSREPHNTRPKTAVTARKSAARVHPLNQALHDSVAYFSCLQNQPQSPTPSLERYPTMRFVSITSKLKRDRRESRYNVGLPLTEADVAFSPLPARAKRDARVRLPPVAADVLAKLPVVSTLRKAKRSDHNIVDEEALANEKARRRRELKIWRDADRPRVAAPPRMTDRLRRFEPPRAQRRGTRARARNRARAREGNADPRHRLTPRRPPPPNATAPGSSSWPTRRWRPALSSRPSRPSAPSPATRPTRSSRTRPRGRRSARRPSNSARRRRRTTVFGARTSSRAPPLWRRFYRRWAWV